MLTPENLLQVRRYSENYQPTCPVHLRIQDCAALFHESGLIPDRQAVACLGDILENFALYVLDRLSAGEIGRYEVERALKDVLA